MTHFFASFLCVLSLCAACDDTENDTATELPSEERGASSGAETASSETAPAGIEREGQTRQRAENEGSEARSENADVDEANEAHAGEADRPLIAIDTHIDTPQRMVDGIDITARLESGHVDLPRMREGGLSAAFFSVFVNPNRYDEGERWNRAILLVDAITEFAEAHEEVQLCRSASDVRQAAAEGKTAILMGVEGAQALDTDRPALALSRLRTLFERGCRYMTITWSTDNPLGHSSLGDDPSGGLTSLGRRVVREMNRLGMVVDISHVSDQTFWDVAEIAELPLLASHSSARALSNTPRNMSDDMIRRVAEGGGAVCVNFFSQFLNADYRLARRRLAWRHRDRFRELRESHPYWVDRGVAARALAMEIDPELDVPDLSLLVDHFAHVTAVGGEGAACLGSDFDGVSELPLGMDDVSDLPALFAALEQRELPLRAIAGENVLRVLAANERTAQQD